LTVLGWILLVGFVAQIPIGWSIGVIVLLIGLVFVIASALGPALRGRRHLF
jgi:cbb3-type cytochrome oxidase subunit 3